MSHPILCMGCNREVGSSDKENVNGYFCSDCGHLHERNISIDPSCNVGPGWEVQDGLLVHPSWNKDKQSILMDISVEELQELKKGFHFDRKEHKEAREKLK